MSQRNYELAESCFLTCPLQDMRDAMLEHWQGFEAGVRSQPNTELKREGRFQCAGSRPAKIGPFAMGHACQAEVVQEPQARMIPPAHLPSE